MKQRRFGNVSVRMVASACIGLAMLAPLSATAGSFFDTGLLHVSMLPPDTDHADFRLSFSQMPVHQNDSSFRSTSVSQSTRLPKSLHFAGLAGTLNLAIDRSNGNPLVEGIELAPREILRIVAEENGGIRGLYGRISIRLDF